MEINLTDLNKRNARLFWRIVFEVIDSQPVLTNEITLWDLRDVNRPRRAARWEVDLDPVACDGCTYHDRSAIFPYGYIEFTDRLLTDQVPALSGYDFPGITEPFLGHNIAVRADVVLGGHSSPCPLSMNTHYSTTRSEMRAACTWRCHLDTLRWVQVQETQALPRLSQVD